MLLSLFTLSGKSTSANLSINNGRPPQQGRRSMDTRFDPNEVKNACVLINTADYCQTTAQEVSASLFLPTMNRVGLMWRWFYSSRRNCVRRWHLSIRRKYPSKRNATFSSGMPLPSVSFRMCLISITPTVLHHQLSSFCSVNLK